MGMWGHRVLRSAAALALLLLLLLALVQAFTLTRMAGDVPPLFRVVDLPGAENSLGAIDLARFAVSQHNNKTNARLGLEKVLRVKQQLVVGTLYYITIQVNEGGAKKLYEAKVVVQPWLDSNSKQLVKFKPADDKLCSFFHIISAFLPWLNRAVC